MSTIDVNALANGLFQAKVEETKGEAAVKQMKALGLTKDPETVKQESEAECFKIVNPMIETQRVIVKKLGDELAEARTANKPEGWLQEQYDLEMAYQRKLMGSK